MPTHTSTRAARPWTRLLALLSLVILAGLTGTSLGRWLNPAAPPPPANPDLPDKLCPGWPKPDLALVLSGQQHGYLLPCGCSKPQLGGLERRYNFIQKLRALGWPVTAVDLGDIPQNKAQAHLINNLVIPKYRTSMQALKLMGYGGVGIGVGEIEQPLVTTVAEFALNNGNDYGPPYLLAANIDDTTRRNVDNAIKPWILLEPPGSRLKVGVTSVIGRQARVEAMKKDKTTIITDTAKALEPVLKAMDAAHADLRILLYHGSAIGQNTMKGNPPEAIAVAMKYPEFQVIVCLDDDDLAPKEPKVVPHADGKGSTLVITLGHKGKAVGLVGVYRGKPGEPLSLRYQLAEMSESFVTPEGKDADNPVLALMEGYAQRLKQDDAVRKFPQTRHPLQLDQGDKIPKFVGSGACADCHRKAYEVWSKSGHSEAFKALEDAKRPSLRQFDPECIVCHTVGFGRISGYTDKVKTAELMNVGCENCHGPASLHAENAKNKEWQQKLNPWKAPADESAEAKIKRLDRIDQMCQSCHDVDNDVNWVNDGFKRHWPKIEHSTPPKKP